MNILIHPDSVILKALNRSPNWTILDVLDVSHHISGVVIRSCKPRRESTSLASHSMLWEQMDVTNYRVNWLLRILTFGCNRLLNHLSATESNMAPLVCGPKENKISIQHPKLGPIRTTAIFVTAAPLDVTDGNKSYEHSRKDSLISL